MYPRTIGVVVFSVDTNQPSAMRSCLPAVKPKFAANDSHFSGLVKGTRISTILGTARSSYALTVDYVYISQRLFASLPVTLSVWSHSMPVRSLHTAASFDIRLLFEDGVPMDAFSITVAPEPRFVFASHKYENPEFTLIP